MPNGKAGDHPFTDIVNHRLSVFSSEIDQLVQELATTSAAAEVSKLVWDQEPIREWQYDPVTRAALLQPLLQRLKAIQARVKE